MFTFTMKLVCFPYKVFLDEVNTSSCMGLFKEMIIDKTFEGEVLIINQYIKYLASTYFIAYTF